jgi:hypothetical protein
VSGTLEILQSMIGVSAMGDTNPSSLTLLYSSVLILQAYITVSDENHQQ